MSKRWAAGLLIAVTGCGAVAAPLPRVGVWNLAEQRVSGETSVVVPGDGLDRHVSILVTIGVDGTVLETKALDNSGYHPPLASSRGVVVRTHP